MWLLRCLGSCIGSRPPDPYNQGLQWEKGKELRCLHAARHSSCMCFGST